MDIKIGDKVRSYDHIGRFTPELDGDRPNHGIIGTVLAVNVKSVPIEGGREYEFDCPRYAIMVESQFMGKEVTAARQPGLIVYPPMNGTKTTMGETCDCVELAE